MSVEKAKELLLDVSKEMENALINRKAVKGENYVKILRALMEFMSFSDMTMALGKTCGMPSGVVELGYDRVLSAVYPISGMTKDEFMECLEDADNIMTMVFQNTNRAIDMVVEAGGPAAGEG